MIGLRMGLANGLRTGLATGIGADPIRASAPASTWTVDGTSGIAVPATPTEWTTFLTAKSLTISVPDAIWNLQESSGDAADSSGNGFTLTATGALAYRQSVAGWARKAITFTEATSGSLKSTSASLPDITTTSQFTLLIASVATPTGVRRIIGHGATRSELRAVTTPVFRVMSGTNQADGTTDPAGAIRPFGLRTNRTASSTTGFTDNEKIAPTFSTSITGRAACLGANGDSAAPAMSALYAVEWHGVHAEISDADYKSLLQAMGLTITWT